MEAECSLFPTGDKGRAQKDFFAQEPHKVLLHFNLLLCITVLNYKDFEDTCISQNSYTGSDKDPD